MTTVNRTTPHPGVSVLELNRPERLNALDFELVADLHTALDEVAADDGCKVVVVTGAGRGFCAGLDLKDWGELPPVGSHPWRPAGVSGQTFISSLSRHVRATPQIVLSAINGPAFGGGLAIALAGDLRIAATSATLCAAFIRTGLTATDVGISYFLPRLIGASRAFDLMLTGRTIDAAEAERLGIVSRVVHDDHLVDEALAMAAGLTAFTAVGLRMSKEVLWANLDAPNLDACLAVEDRNQDLAGRTEEVAAFMAAYRRRITS